LQLATGGWLLAAGGGFRSKVECVGITGTGHWRLAIGPKVSTIF